MDTQNAKTNNFYSETYRKITHSQPINREEIIKNFNEETIKRVWEVFCGFVSKNYQFGKGTVIPSFGTFTFSNAEVNLEGTTNQFIRDKKQRNPVFIVSNDFVEYTKPGIFTEKGIIHYKQSLNNSISHVKINYAELSISANLNKAEFVTMIDHIIRLIGESIRNVKLF
jgi:hypothetical protein